MKMWLDECDVFLEEMMGHEGRGNQPSSNCTVCALEGGPTHMAKYECCDCHGRELLCQLCIIQRHIHNPLHQIKVHSSMRLPCLSSAVLILMSIQNWNGLYFEKISLRKLGLWIQLGHPPGVRCPNPEQCTGDEFTILDNRAIFSVSLDFCACGEGSQSKTVQLLRSKFYPTTVANPRSAATFRMLETFELLLYISKVSAFEYYQALSRLTDNTGLNVPNVHNTSRFCSLY
jgi:hypothetical protein